MDKLSGYDWFDDQIKQRKLRDVELFEDSLIHMTGAVMGNRIALSLMDNRQVTRNAMEEILKYYHLKGTELPDGIEDPQDQLEYLCRPHGLMRRNVKLKPGWHRDAVGPMLGLRKSDHNLVALLPSKNFSGYTCPDEETGRRKAVNNETEKQLEDEAICFYKPFPLKKLGIRDLIRFMVEALTISDILPIILTMCLFTALGLFLPRMNHILFSTVIESGSISLLLGAAIFLVSINITTTLITSMKSLLMSRVQIKLSIGMQSAAMMRILSLPADFFRGYQSGELSQRINYFEMLCNIILDMVLSTGLSSVFSLAYIAQIFNFAPDLVVPALFITLATVVFTFVSTMLNIRLSREKMELSAKENGLTHSMVTGVQKIRLSGAEKRAFAIWAKTYSDSARLEYNPPLFFKINPVISEAIALIGTMIMYFIAIRSGISLADYYAFDTAFAMVSAAFMSLAGIATQIAQIKPVLEMIRPILETEPEISENKLVLSRLSGGIELSHISFRYNENMPLILDDLSIRIRPRQYIAIVGKTGCGKSTLMRLLLGFEIPQRGAVYYDGRDISGVDLRSLRKNIGSVMQNGKLFTGSIYDNIVISAPWLTLDDAWEAAETAGIADDIRAMPMGMQTIISEGSGGISGGQKQRLLIARAIAPKPRVLIFDEATSALDNLTQKKVSEALDQLKCTRIVIAHRLSTIRSCDRILVLDGGKVTEDGSYDELIARGGFFAELVERQRTDV